MTIHGSDVASLPALAGTSFDHAAGLVLAHLREHVPMALWSVTRVENGRQTHLHLDEANPYGLVRGSSVPWESTFCISMVAGTSPAVAPDATIVPAYARAADLLGERFRAYAGTPLREPGGELFGVLCGLDTERSQDPRLKDAGPLLQLLGQLLSLVLAADRSLDAEAARAVEATLAAETDALTGLWNRRAWDRLVGEEQRRLHRFGDPTAVVVLDLDGLKVVNDTAGHAAGDAHLQAAATGLRASVKKHDVVARLGGDEFGLVLRDCTPTQAVDVCARVEQTLREVGVEASVGWAAVTVLRGLPIAVAEADAAMYRVKASRRPSRRTA